MGENTKISWTDHTWNPWMGCTKISAGCKNCYMFREQLAYGKDPTEIRRSKTTFNDPYKWHEPARVFVCSWSDFFHPDIPLEWRDDAWDIMRLTKHLTYQILTKRPDNIKSLLPDDWGDGWPNVLLGVTVEDADNIWRMEVLAGIPAALRFVSYEPALGPLPPAFVSTYSAQLRWLIAGGESGPGCRWPDPNWIHNAREQCLDEGVPFFFKQWGGTSKLDGVWGGDRLGGLQYHEFPG